MMLDKKDLIEIKKIVVSSIDKSEERMSGRIDSAIENSEAKMSKKIDSAIEKSEERMSGRIDSAIEKTELKMSDKMEFLIEKYELKIISVIKESENNIINKMDREISDLVDINRAAISRTDQIDYRLSIVERKLGIKN